MKMTSFCPKVFYNVLVSAFSMFTVSLWIKSEFMILAKSVTKYCLNNVQTCIWKKMQPPKCLMWHLWASCPFDVSSSCSDEFLRLLRPAASRPHHPERRPGDCDEAGAHPGVRHPPGLAGQGGQRLRLLRASRQVRSTRRGELQSIKGRHSKCNCPVEYIPPTPFFIF